ncbi:MAG: hypothetical protein JRG99_02235, partial [Deltaproteobacteria bacterium]|nr:hypothetical protein [Deltaproteobacteria bacterium]
YVLPLAFHKHGVSEFNEEFLSGIDSAHILDESPITLEGKGQDIHKKVVQFIVENLKSWGVKVQPNVSMKNSG